MFHGGVLGSQPEGIDQVSIGALEIGGSHLGSVALALTTFIPAISLTLPRLMG